jgi:hypothetical protein
MSALHRISIALFGCLLVVLPGQAAQASRLQTAPATVAYYGAGGERNRLSVTRDTASDDEDARVLFQELSSRSRAALGIRSIAPCEPFGTKNPSTRASCPLAGVRLIRIEVRDGSDSVVAGAIDRPFQIEGGDGSDILDGGQGFNRISGQDGDDIITGDRGIDRMSGGDGNDYLRDRSRPDQEQSDLDGGRGNDFLVGGPGRARFLGGDGRDTIRDVGGEGDIVFAGRGDDEITLRDGQRDRVACGSGTDRVIIDFRDTIVRGGDRDVVGVCESIVYPRFSRDPDPVP